jgi:hypothetical protein
MLQCQVMFLAVMNGPAWHLNTSYRCQSNLSILRLVQELVELSLSAPGRVTLPRAPPHTLLLSGSLFSPFPTGWGLDTPLVAKWTGDRLRLRDVAQGELQEFRQQVSGCLGWVLVQWTNVQRHTRLG